MASSYAKIKENFDAGHLLSDSEKAELRRLSREAWDPNQGSVRDLSTASVSKLQDARSTEHQARSKVASMRRMLQDARTEHAKAELRERRWAEAAAYRAQQNRDKPNLMNVERFNADEVVGMAVRFVQRMAELEPDANKRAWYTLFKHMDDDGSGKINFPELVDMVRTELRLKPKEMLDSSLKSLWASLDEDGSGFIAAGEFGHFMKKGEKAVRTLRPQTTWKQKLASTRRLEAEAVTTALNKEKDAMASVAAANMEGVEEMSLEFNRRMHKLLVGSWYKLFKQMDDDGSGKITFDELLDMVRSELEFSPKDISDTALKRVWAALDNDRSGYLTSGEFGAFMRKGEAALRVLRPQSTWKEKLHSTRRLEAAAVTAGLNKEKNAMSNINPAGEDRVLELAVRLLQKMGQIEPDPGKRSWYRMFKHMDDDGSGRITYYELVDMVRNELRIHSDELQDSSLKSVWAALDDDGSGFITAGEFGSFMRKGEVALRMLRPQTTWKQKLAVVRRQEAAAVTAALNKERNAMVGVEPADEMQIAALSKRLNMQIARIEPVPTKQSWYRIFKQMDDDGSGKITFAELLPMIRGVLEISTKAIPDAIMRRLWAALDEDGSGFLTAGEFGHFMKIGEAELRTIRKDAGLQTTWKQRLHTTRRLEAAALTAKMNKERDAMAGVRPADRHKCKVVAEQFHTKLLKLFPQNPAWYKLFSQMDNDGSGRITYEEMAEMVRRELELGPSQLSEGTLRSVWASLDDDRSGFITAGEFGKFMKLGTPESYQVPMFERRRIASARARASLEMTTAKLAERQMVDSNKLANQYENEVAQLGQELAALRRPLSARVPHPPPARAASARARPAAALPRSFLDAGPLPTSAGPGASPYLAGASPVKTASGGEMPWLKDAHGRRLP